MACKIEPKLGQDGQLAKWDPKQIPSTKPFVRIVTSAYEPVTTIDNMRFVKTRSLIYIPFHKEARYVNFEIGYPKEAKWLEFVTEKWQIMPTSSLPAFLRQFIQHLKMVQPPLMHKSMQKI